MVIISGVGFEWDSTKSKKNEAKHGISFEEAQSVFSDEKGRLVYDPDHSIEEDRFILLGLSSKLRMLVVSHCYKSEDSLLRIISARKATKNEQRQYEEFLP